MRWKTIKTAVRLTLPVMMGYLSVGIAFGLLMDAAAYPAVWSFFMSLFVYAGSAQFIGVELLSSRAPLLQAALLILIVNFRHIVFGLSFLDKYRGMGWRKLNMIFALTDETYALRSATPVPEEMDRGKFYFTVSLLNQLYWITGSVLGSLAGVLIPFQLEGVEFAMTALFTVIAVEQWKNRAGRIPALIGFGCAVVSLLFFGPDKMLIPALIAIVLLLLSLRPLLNKQKETEAADQ
jgi:4-azaleucine resistance transporter AzlC